MTPVTRGVTNRQKDGFIFGAGPGKGFIAPRVPLDGIAGVLKKIRTAFVRETIHRRIMTLPVIPDL